MIKTKQQSSISRIWQSINQNWGVAIGFLMLLLIVPAVVLVTNTTNQNIVVTQADSTKPIIRISPPKGQGTSQLFVAEVSDQDVNKLDTVDLWWGAAVPSSIASNSDYATIGLKNFSENGGLDWRASTYDKDSNGSVRNLAYIAANDDSNSEAGKVYAYKSSTADAISLSTQSRSDAIAVVKFRKVTKTTQNLVDFYLDVTFKPGFKTADVNIYMRAARALKYGGNSSGAIAGEWSKVGVWNTTKKVLGAQISNLPPRVTTVPSSKSTVGKLYQYAIGAIDPENQDLTYSILTSPKPAWLSLSGNVLTGTPATSDIGAYPIVVVISDPIGNTVTQSWTINVVAGSSTTPSVVLTITSPVTGTTFGGANNKISWTISSTNSVANIRISYALQGSSNYNVIAQVSPSGTSYTWDTTSLSKGNYIVKVEALDTSGNVIPGSTATSSSFTVDNSPSTSTVEKPRLTGKFPEETTIYDRQPKITATINEGSAKIDFTSLKVYLDQDTNATAISDDKVNFVTSGNTFTYNPSSDLGLGNHTVRVIVGGTDAKTDADKLDTKWTFTIDEKKDAPVSVTLTPKPNQITLPIVNIQVDSWLGTIIIALFVLLLFGVLIFAIVMLIRILRSDDDEMKQITQYYQQGQIPALPTSTSETQTTTTVTSTSTPTSPDDVATVDLRSLYEPSSSNSTISPVIVPAVIPSTTTEYTTQTTTTPAVPVMPVDNFAMPTITTETPADTYLYGSNDTQLPTYDMTTPIAQTTTTTSSTITNTAPMNMPSDPTQTQMSPMYTTTDLNPGSPSQVIKNPSDEPYDPFK